MTPPFRTPIRTFRIAVTIAVTAASALACSDSDDPSTTIVERRISPTSANAAVTKFTQDNFVWLSPSANASKLMVFLPGTSGVPEAYTRLARVVAEQGYRVIGLMYPDDAGVVFVCSSSADPDCMEKLRHEIVDGGDYSDLASIDATNSIVGRLVDLLTLLARDHPTEGWNAFLLGDIPRWDLITVSGHSQGGGHAAYIAKTRSVDRVVMFGAPADGFDANPGRWVEPGATGSFRYYGFRHLRDPFTSISPNWLALGLDQFGPVLTVDATTTDFAGSHMLITDALPATGSYNEAHASVAGNGATPSRADGSPAFAAIWRYLFGSSN